MARAIIRYSLDGDTGVTNTYVRNFLEPKGFTRIGTASFEVPDEPMADLLSILQELLANHLTEPTPGGGRIDYLWVYLDQPPSGSN